MAMCSKAMTNTFTLKAVCDTIASTMNDEEHDTECQWSEEDCPEFVRVPPEWEILGEGCCKKGRLPGADLQ